MPRRYTRGLRLPRRLQGKAPWLPAPPRAPPKVRLMVFWGYAGWSRCQLMGEIARGSWGLCRAETRDVVSTGFDEVWRAVYGRLLFAPKSEMSESYGGQVPQEQERRRELRRMATFHDLLRRAGGEDTGDRRRRRRGDETEAAAGDGGDAAAAPVDEEEGARDSASDDAESELDEDQGSDAGPVEDVPESDGGSPEEPEPMDEGGFALDDDVVDPLLEGYHAAVGEDGL